MPPSTSAASRAARADAFAALDEALLDLRRLWLHPRLLRWFSEQVGSDVEIATLRTLRAIESNRGQPLGISDLAAILAVDASTASRLVETVVADGHVERRPGRRDRRRTELALTASGQRMLARANEVRERLLGRATESWTDEELGGLASSLARLQADLRGLLEHEECP